MRCPNCYSEIGNSKKICPCCGYDLEEDRMGTTYISHPARGGHHYEQRNYRECKNQRYDSHGYPLMDGRGYYPQSLQGYDSEFYQVYCQEYYQNLIRREERRQERRQHVLMVWLIILSGVLMFHSFLMILLLTVGR